MKPTALIIRTAGTNCDRELAHAFTLAGAQPETVHLNRLIQEPAIIDRADLIGFPGGFSYGDDICRGADLSESASAPTCSNRCGRLWRGVSR